MIAVLDRGGCFQTDKCGGCGHLIYREFPIVEGRILVESPGRWFHTLSLFVHCDAARSKEARPAWESAGTSHTLQVSSSYRGARLEVLG